MIGQRISEADETDQLNRGIAWAVLLTFTLFYYGYN
jgi:hypothetical protein